MRAQACVRVLFGEQGDVERHVRAQACVRAHAVRRCGASASGNPSRCSRGTSPAPAVGIGSHATGPGKSCAGPGPTARAPPQTGFSRATGYAPRPARPAHNSPATETAARTAPAPPADRPAGAGRGSPPAPQCRRNPRAPPGAIPGRRAAYDAGSWTAFIPRTPTIAPILRFSAAKVAKHFFSNRPQPLKSLTQRIWREWLTPHYRPQPHKFSDSTCFRQWTTKREMSYRFLTIQKRVGYHFVM